ncbi:hypothetical protein [Streptomyces sp. NPDC058644]|uniref:hypothetical protein n=1 Tax=unclassified Streptomyces TaxID=2593676 RepID=UPI0036512566
MTTADFRPTHVVPQDGLPAWEAPDADLPTTPLDALLPVRLIDRLGDWGRIVCANGWSAWVDGRLLVAVPQDPPAAGHPLTRSADPGPLLKRTEDALGRYRRATEELAAGDGDRESFRSRTRGLRVGVVVDGESMWLYDAEHERWVYCDGTRLSTYAAREGPSVHGEGPVGAPPAGAGGPEPTQVVGGAVSPGGTAAPEPTQVVEAVSGTEPGDAPAAYGEGPGRLPDPYADEETRRIPPVTVDPGPAAGRDGGA